MPIFLSKRFGIFVLTEENRDGAEDFPRWKRCFHVTPFTKSLLKRSYASQPSAGRSHVANVTSSFSCAAKLAVTKTDLSAWILSTDCLPRSSKSIREINPQDTSGMSDRTSTALRLIRWQEGTACKNIQTHPFRRSLWRTWRQEVVKDKLSAANNARPTQRLQTGPHIMPTSTCSPLSFNLIPLRSQEKKWNKIKPANLFFKKWINSRRGNSRPISSLNVRWKRMTHAIEDLQKYHSE